MALSAPPTRPLVMYFDYPTNYYLIFSNLAPQQAYMSNWAQVTNLVYRCYSTNNLNSWMSNWTSQVVNPTFTNGLFQFSISATSDFQFYTVSWSNFWGESFFAGAVATPPLLTNLNNLKLSLP